MAENTITRWYQPAWTTTGNTLQLLHGSHEFFSALVAAIQCSEHSIWLETYIFDSRNGAYEVVQALAEAAQRGVCVHVLVDGVGSGALDTIVLNTMREAGVQLRFFAKPEGMRLVLPKYWRRLHRKLCVVDGQMAFCGGINILDDYHDPNHGALSNPRWDFTVQITSGRLVGHIEQVCRQLWRLVGDKHGANKQGEDVSALHSTFSHSRVLNKFNTCILATQTHFPQVTECAVRLLLRDNLRNRHSIEKAYLKAIAQAKHRIVIANAYFFPSLKLQNALIRACKRGVAVQLLLQGRYEYFMQYYAIKALYPRLIAAGVEIYEYNDSFLHAKVAVIDAGYDGAWATIGSSNLDPLSLLLAREANLEVLDNKFARVLLSAVEQAIMHSSEHIDESQYLRKRGWWARRVDRFAYFWARFATWFFSGEY